MSNETKWTKGPWRACVLVGDDGVKMTPEQIGEYVTEAIKAGPSPWFSFVIGEKPDGEYDICHVGNGEDSPFNAHLIAAAPDMADALMCWPLSELLGMVEDSGDTAMRERAKWFMEVRDFALAKARGEKP